MGKVAVVTGAANGIGLVSGARAWRRTAPPWRSPTSRPNFGEAAAKGLRDEGYRAIFVATDVAKREAIEALIERAVGEFGGLDIMLNNAGVALTGSILEMTDELFDKVLATNLRSAFIGSQLACAPG